MAQKKIQRSAPIRKKEEKGKVIQFPTAKKEKPQKFRDVCGCL